MSPLISTKLTLHENKKKKIAIYSLIGVSFFLVLNNSTCQELSWHWASMIVKSQAKQRPPILSRCLKIFKMSLKQDWNEKGEGFESPIKSKRCNLLYCVFVRKKKKPLKMNFALWFGITVGQRWLLLSQPYWSNCMEKQSWETRSDKLLID